MIEDNFIYFPEGQMVGDPSVLGIDYEDIYFQTSDGIRLNGWFAPGERDITLLWFHGNAGNISHRLDNLVQFHRKLGAGIFIFDYRGYGNSEGKPSEEGTYLDAQAALDYLHTRQDVRPDQIIFFGRSLGCAVAIDLAGRNNCPALILESPFTSVKDMAKRIFPLIPGALIRIKYDSITKIRQISPPLLVLHGDQDEVVPFKLGQRLYEAANEPKEFYVIEGAGHNDTYLVGGEKYLVKLNEFISGLFERGNIKSRD